MFIINLSVDLQTLCVVISAAIECGLAPSVSCPSLRQVLLVSVVPYMESSAELLYSFKY